jgi:hypothetical protein
MAQSKLDVSKWQACRPQWHYTPALWFYWRMVEAALLDVRAVEGVPTDQALLVRAWVAWSESSPARAPRRFVSFPECCDQLGLNVEVERMALLELIDGMGDFDTDEAWARLAVLEAADSEGDEEPLFEGMRVVPALDQMSLFAA